MPKNKKTFTRIRSILERPSIVKVFTTQFLPIIALFGALFVIVFSYFLFQARKDTYQDVKRLLQSYNTQLTENLDAELGLLMEICFSSTDLAMLNIDISSSAEYNYIMKVKKLLSGQMSLNPTVDGIFVYIPEKDIFIPGYTSTSLDAGFNESYLYPSFIRDILNDQNHIEHATQSSTAGWFFVTNKWGNYLLRFVRVGSSYAGAWLNADNLAALDSSLLGESLCFFTDASGAYLFGDDPEMMIHPGESTLYPQNYRLPNGKKYVAITEKITFGDYYLTIMVPNSLVTKTVSPFLWFFLFFLGWLVLFFVFVIRLVRKVLMLPTLSLQPMIEEIHSGNFNTKLAPPNDYEEIVQITNSFNTLLSEIQGLKNHVYEEQLQRRNFELKFLKSQIAPHFLINCLNTILVSSQNKENEEITNQMITTLSDHLRYTLSNRTVVPLNEELLYLENYLHLTQYRFPGTLSYQIQCPELLVNTKVFPLILLTLTENSIKTGLIMGEPFQIRIDCSSYFRDGKTHVRLKHTDSGSGLTKEQLHDYNHIFHHPEVTKKGTGIGIYNTALRLKLILGEDATIRFYNEPDMGLSVEIDFLYQEFFDDEITELEISKGGTNHEHSGNR